MKTVLGHVLYSVTYVVEYPSTFHSMVLKRIRKAISYGRAAYGAYKSARKYLRRRRRKVYNKRTMPVSYKAVTSKRYGAKMNKIFHVGRVQNPIVTVPLFKPVKDSGNKFYQLPCYGIAVALQRVLPLEMFYLKRFYQSFKLHSFKVTATVYSTTLPQNSYNYPARIAIAADYLYRSQFFTTQDVTEDNVNTAAIGFVDYSDMMELPNTKTRDVLLSNLNNGSSISLVVKPGPGCYNPHISTDKLDTTELYALPDLDTEHGSANNNYVTKSSN